MLCYKVGCPRWIVWAYVSSAMVVAGCGSAPTEPVVDPTPVTTPTAFDEPPTMTDTSGYLDIMADEPTEILVDGAPAGTTPISAHKVTPGSHEVTFVDNRRGNRTMAVTVGPGESATVKSDPAPSIIEEKPEKDK